MDMGLVACEWDFSFSLVQPQRERSPGILARLLPRDLPVIIENSNIINWMNHNRTTGCPQKNDTLFWRAAAPLNF